MHAVSNCNIRPLRRPASVIGGQRRPANMPARIKIGSTRTTCTVKDVSSSGACLTLDDVMAEDVSIWLIIGNLPPIQATAAWRKSNRIGLRFHQDQQWLEQDHKDRFDPTAWLRNSPAVH